MRDAALKPLFEAVADATDEAIYNAILRATSTHDRDGHTAEAVPSTASNKPLPPRPRHG